MRKFQKPWKMSTQEMQFNRCVVVHHSTAEWALTNIVNIGIDDIDQG